MIKKWRACSYLGKLFLAITQLFWTNWAEFFFGNSGNYYLLVGGEKSKVWSLFLIFDFLGHFWRENGRGHQARPLWSWASKPNQKVDPLGGNFWSTAYPSIYRLTTTNTRVCHALRIAIRID